MRRTYTWMTDVLVVNILQQASKCIQYINNAMVAGILTRRQKGWKQPIQHIMVNLVYCFAYMHASAHISYAFRPEIKAFMKHRP